MNKSNSDETYSDEEIARREDASLKRILSTPPKPHSEMKIGKRKAKAGPRVKPPSLPKRKEK
jgi:hypothetical protein